MMISAMYPKESVDTLINIVTNVAVWDGVNGDDMELLRNFITSLSNLNREGGVMICKPGDYSRMDDAELMLECLKGAGVDNWGGYDDALEDYWNAKEDEDE
ncbi:MAG: hypothetical protein ACRC6V_04990 [Bacteroidales bacterium]